MSHNTRLLGPAVLARTVIAVFGCLGSGLLAAPAGPAVSATKSDGNPAATKIVPGSTVTYTTRISNGGPEMAADLVFEDPEINGATYVGSSLAVTPVAADDTFATAIVPNTTVTSGTFSVVDNDLPGYVSGTAVLKTALTISAFDATSANSGTVSMTTTGSEVGRFTYSPRPGFTGTDTFKYTISNTVPDGPAGSITGTVTLTVAGNVIWFVNPAAGTNGNGTLSAPFNVFTGLAAAINGSATTTDRVYIYSDATLSSGVTLPANTIVVGRGTIGSDFQGLMGVTYPAITTGTIPSINGTNPTLTRASGGDTVTLGENNIITGVTITNTGGGFAVRGTGIAACQIGSTAVQISAAGSDASHDVALGSSGGSSGALSFTGGAGGAIAVNAPITSTAGRSVNIQNRSSSTVTFSRPITDSAQGLSLASNTGATISFTAGLALSTGANTAFSATGGGTVTATQNNGTIVNTISTTTGQALNVANTTIGAAGLNFRSIASNGSGTAINLATTGTSGGLTVTGNGTANSGGVIRNTTGDSIRLSNTSKVSLTRVSVQSSLGHGIFGTGVNGFILDNCAVTNCGNASNENGIRFADSDTASINETGLYGSATNGSYPTRIISSSVTGSNGNNLEIVNYGSNALSNLSIETSTFSNSINGGGIQFEIRGSGASANHSTVNATGCTINGNFSQGVDGQALDDASLTINVGTTGLAQNAEGIVLANSFNGDLTYDLNGNTITNTNASPRSGTAIACVNGTLSTSSAVYRGKVRNNTINTGGIDNSGLAFFLAGDAVSTLQLHNNNITVGPNANFEGVFLQVGESGGADDTVTGNLTVTNNTVAVAGLAGGNGMLIQSRFSATMRALISGNTCAPGTGGVSGIRIRQRDKSRVELPGYLGSPLAGNSVASFVDANNPTPTTVTATFSDDPSVVTDGYFNTAAGAPVVLPLTFAPGGIERISSPAPEMATEMVSAELPVAGPAAQATSAWVSAEGGPEIPALSPAGLEAIVAEAIERWEATGLTAEQVGHLRGLKFGINDLDHSHLGEASGDTIRIDPTAGGSGWFMDSGTASDGLFGTVKSVTRRQTDSSSAPAGRVDLLTTVMHEMGHALGLPDSYHPEDRESIMYGLLVHGERRYPSKDQAKGAQPFAHARGHFLTGGLNPLVIGDLPPGKEVVVTYRVTVANPAMGSTISSQGTVSGSNLTDVLTDDKPAAGDPALPEPADPTVTLLDLPDVSVAVSAPSVLEDGDGILTYTFTRSGSPAVALPAGFTFTGTAAAGDDFTIAAFDPGFPEPANSVKNLDAATGTFNFAAGQSTATLVVIPTDDTGVENNETVICNVAAGVAYDIGSPASVSGTITNDDTSIALTLPDSSVFEDQTDNLAYTFTRSGVATGTTVATFSVGGSAALNTDYTVTGATTFSASSGTVTFGPNETVKVVTVNPAADNVIESGDETADLTLTASTGYTVTGTTLQSGTITDDDSSVTIAVAPASASEDSATGLVYTLTRTGPSDNELTVNVRVGGTAALTGDFGHDFASLNTTTGDATVAFTAGSSTRAVTITPTADTTLEADETVILTLAANGTPAVTGGYAVGTTSQATGTILNDDTQVSVAATTATTAEDSETPLAFVFSRAGNTSAALTVNFTVGGTAGFTSDYTQTGAASFAAAGGSVTFAANAATATVGLSPVEDFTVESDETVILSVTAATGYQAVAPVSATGTITNDDTDVSVAVSPASASEDGPGTLTYTFTRTGVTTGALTANFTVGGTAALTTDYTQSGAATFVSGSGTVTFAPTVLTAAITVDPAPDNAVEGNETIILTPAAGTGYSPVTTAATGTINDDDSTVTVALLAADSVVEDGDETLVYTFARTAPATDALTVNVKVTGTAALTGDYAHNFGSFNTTTGEATVAFGAGEATRTVTIDPTADTTKEADETVILTLAANGTPVATGGYAVGTPASASGTIEDDDLPQVAIAATTPAASEGGADGLYTFTRNATDGELTAKFKLAASSTADAETDFTLTGTGVDFDASTGEGTVVFPDTVASVTVDLIASTEAAVSGGQAAEGDETVRFDIVPEADVYGGTANATVTIAANGFIVVNTSDAGEGSLRQAVANANAIAGSDAIGFSDGSGNTVDFSDAAVDVILLMSGQLLVSSDLSIISPEAAELRIERGPSAADFRIFEIAGGSTVALTGLAIVNGSVTGLADGGGILTAADELSLTRCALRGNTSSHEGGGFHCHAGSVVLSECVIEANGSGGSAGAYAVRAGTVTFVGSAIRNNTSDVSGAGGLAIAGTVNYVNSSIHDNTAGGGSGGLYVVDATCNVINSTFSGNVALGGGGGGIYSEGTLVVTQSTISGNSASTTGGGIDRSAGAVTISNSIIAGNNATAAAPDLAGTIIDGGGNLVGIADGSTGITTSTLTGSLATPLDPLLGPLADNGGLTPTHALLADSPALNAGSNSAIPADIADLDDDNDTTEPAPFDQRGDGFSRLIGTVDIGAVELQKSLSIAASSATVGEGAGSAEFTVSRVGPTTGDVSVTYTVGGGSSNAAATADFGTTFPTDTVTIPDGETSVSFTVPISDDGIVELNETFVVTLSDPTAGYIVTAAVAGTEITDNDSATLSVAKASDGAETNPAAADGSFLVTQSAAASTRTTIAYSLSGSATSGVDYTAPSGSVTFAAGETTAAIPIAVIRDFLVEGPEDVTVTLGAVTGDAQITVDASADSATLRITDNAPGSIAVSSGSSQSAMVGTAFGDSLVAIVKDADGNTLEGAAVTFTAPASAASGTFASSATVLTDASGLATAPAFTANTTAGSYTVTASSTGTPASFALTNNPAAAASFVLAAPGTASAGSPVNFTVTAHDAFGNVATSYAGTVGFTSTDALATHPSDTVLTHGTKTLPVTFATGGSQTITAADTSAPGISGTSAPVVVSPVADLAVTVTDGVTSATPGSSVAYTITIRNFGPSPVTGATVTDVFPAALTASWTGAGAGSGAGPASGTGNIDASVNLPVGGSFIFTVDATISSSASGSLVNTAAVAAPAGTTDPDLTNNSATDTDTLSPQANLAITKTDGVTTGTPGGSLTYTITASNAGPSNVTGATIVDALPAALTGSWTAVGAGGGTATASGSGSINDTVNIPAGGSVTYTVSTMISAAATGTLTNTATVAAPAGTTDPDLTNNSATDTDTLVPRADLTVSMTDGVDTAVPGGSVVYTITVSNPGPSNVPAATVLNTFPGILTGTWTSAVAGGATATASGSGSINDTVGLPVGGSVTYTVNGTVSSSATGTITNTAAVSSTVADQTSANNSATDTNTLTPQADLSISKTDGITTATPGGNVIYTITVSNAGPSDVPDATVADTFPAIFTGSWTSTAAGGATATASGTGSINDSADIPAGGSVTYTVSGTVSASATGTLSNTATVTSTVNDAVPANNSATDTDTLAAESDLSVVVAGSPGPVDAGSNLTYTITVTNSGPSVAPAVTLADVLPAGTTFVSLTTPGGWSATTPAVGTTGTIEVSAADLPVGTSVFTLVVKVDYVADGTVISNSAMATTTTDDPDPANNTGTATTTVSAIPEIVILDGVTPLASGSGTVDFGTTTFGNPLNRTLTVRNVGTGDLILSGISMPSGFSVTTAGVASRTIRPTESFDIVLSYDAPTVGTTSGTVSLGSNDGDEPSFAIPVSGTRTNVAPVAAARNVVTDEDIALPIDLAGTDVDGDAMTYIIVTPPAKGSLSGPVSGPLAAGIVNKIYTPATNYNGGDSFIYKVNDGSADSAVVTVVIDIDEVNDPPTVIAPGITDILHTRPGLTESVDFQAYFSDVETLAPDLDYTTAWAADPKVFSAIRTGNSLAITGTAYGTKEITVTAIDPEFGSVQETFRVMVKSMPVIANGGIPATVVSPAAPPQMVDLSTYFADQDGDALVYSVVTNSDPARVVPTINGAALTLAPVSPGTSTLTIRATDVDNNTIDQSFVVTVEEPIPGLDPDDPSLPPVLNLQTGLYEVRVTTTNNNVFDIPGFRLRVTSALPEGMRLHNSSAPVGSNEPYLDVLTHLSPGQSMVIVLEFFSPKRNYDGFAPTIIAEPLPAGLTNDGTGAGMEVNRFVVLDDRSVLIEFKSVAGRYYQIEYSSDLKIWKKSLVPVRAGANYTQWFDRGAPYTDSHPRTSPQRYYRVSEINN